MEFSYGKSQLEWNVTVAMFISGNCNSTKSKLVKLGTGNRAVFLVVNIMVYGCYDICLKH